MSRYVAICLDLLDLPRSNFLGILHLAHLGIYVGGCLPNENYNTVFKSTSWTRQARMISLKHLLHPGI